MFSQLSTLSSQLKAKRGFALLIVVTLLAFLVVLLLGLAVYTRIETSVAGNTQRQAQARENALLALNVALGQLQKYAGPDKRVTATAGAFGGVGATRHLTGVWPSDPLDDPDADPQTPLTWLVSGNELVDATGAPQPLAVTPATALSTTNAVALVSTNTSRTANDVLARLQDIKANGVPGAAPAANTTIGRYAWWVGDQGVKAPVAVPDASASVDYAPFDSVDLRSRIRQQIALGAGAADASGNPLFEPHDTSGGNSSNSALAARTQALSQIAFLKTPANAAVGLNRVQQNFHTWSPNNFAVLANTKLGGLRQDLSIDPLLLGSAFAAWADYASYMEDPATGTAGAPAILPAYGIDPLRRRYRFTPPGANGEPGVAPVLSFFYLYLGVNKPTAAAPFTLSLRWAAALWNPFSSALVPEDLRLEIEGLPPTIVVLNAGNNQVEAVFTPRQQFGDPLVTTLPWNSPNPASEPDKQSWLPGRVYNWTTQPGAVLTSGAFPGRFDSAERVAFSDGIQATVPGSRNFNSNSRLTLRIPARVTLKLKLVRASDGATLATFSSPEYEPVPLSTETAGADNPIHVGYIMRLAENLDSPTSPGDWLLQAQQDIRVADLLGDAFRAVPNGTDPNAYYDYFRVYQTDRLLDRDKTTGTSYNEDVPLFELPRAPILSLGQLQHLLISSARPFSIGNSWGALTPLNGIPSGQLFDRFFFSGLTPAVVPAVSASGDFKLPNPGLKILRGGAAKPAPDDLRTAPAAASSKFLLQGGAFNLNSTDAVAWTAVLRGVRFPAPQGFTYLDAAFSTGTAADDALAPPVQSGDAQFFRFPQSAQETYKADVGFAASTVAPPGPPDVASNANTHLFRQGMRTLTAGQVALLAGKIAEAIKTRHAASGPFRSLEEFLSPATAGGPSLMEQAIADAGINLDASGNPIEFSSQFLTQADIMTALAPVLFPRSDTFVIRAYGEAVNPATTATEGRAWCEAIVQRVPEFFDPSDPPETPLGDFKLPSDPNDPASLPTAGHQLNDRNGRRFKIVSFRWLTRSDI